MVSPTVVSRTAFVSSTTNATTWTPFSNAACVPGELLLFICSADGVPTLSVGGSSSAGWTKLDQASDGTSAVTGAVFWMSPDNNTFTSVALQISSTASEQYSGELIRIRGADSVDVGAAATGSSTNSNPPSNSLVESARDILVVATRSGDSTTVATVAPTNYANLTTQAGGGTNGASTNTADRSLTATQTEDPGTFTSATEQWVSYTVILYQSDALSTGVTISARTNTTVTYRGGSVYEIEKTGGVNGTFDADATSSVSLSGDFVLRLRPLQGGATGMICGVADTPTSDTTYTGIDRAWDYFTSWQVIESGTFQGSSVATSGYTWIWRTGTTIGYGRGTTLSAAQASPDRTVTDSTTYGFDCSFANTNDRMEVLLYTPAASQTLTPSLFTNSQTFFAATVLAIKTLTPSLFTNSQTFFAATVIPGPVTLAPSLFTNSQTFFAATVANVTSLFPALVTNSQTFFAATVTRGAVTLTPSLFTNSNSFFSATITTVKTLVAPLFTNTNTFFSGTVTTSYTLLPSLYTNNQTFFSEVVSQGGSPVTLLPNLFTNSQQFYTLTISQGITLAPALFQNVQQFFPALLFVASPPVVPVKVRRRGVALNYYKKFKTINDFRNRY